VKRKLHPEQIGIDARDSRLRSLVRRLKRICVDRIRYPGDSERLDDLRVALLEGHRLLADIDALYGEDRG